MFRLLSLNRDYQKFTEINLLFSFSLALVSPLLAPYLVSRGFSASQLSLIFSIFPFVNIVFIPLFGRLADKINKKLIIWLGICLEILALALYLIASHWYLIMTARFLDALAASLVVLLILAKIEDSIKSDNRRGRKTGNYLSWSFLGQLIGSLLGACLADRFFIRLPFFMAIVILILLMFYLLMDRLSELPVHRIKLSKLNWWSEIKQFLSFPNLRGMAIMGMVMHATNPAMQIFLPLIIINKIGMSYQAIGLAMFVYGLAHLAQGWFGRLSDYWGHYRLVAASTLLAATALALITWTSSYYWLLFLLFIQGIGTGMWNVSAWSLMSVVGEKEHIEAQVLTSYFSLAKVGALISFFASAWLVQQFGLSMIFLINGIIIFVGVILAWPWLRLSKKYTNSNLAYFSGKGKEKAV